MAREHCPCDSYYVWAEIHIKIPNVLFVLDMGTMVSLLDKKVFDEISECARPVIRDTTATLTSVNTQNVRTYGIEINLQGVRFSHDFWLCDMSQSGIIGMDMLRAQNAIIDFSRDRVVWSEIRAGVQWKRGVYKSRVVSCKSIKVPPGHEAIIKCKTYQNRVKRRSKRCPLSMVRPLGSALVNRGFAVACCMINTADTVIPVRVYNPSEQPLYIRRCTTVRYMEPMLGQKLYTGTKSKGEATVLEPTTVKQIPEHVQGLYEQSIENVESSERPLVEKLLSENADVFATSATDLGKPS